MSNKTIIMSAVTALAVLCSCSEKKEKDTTYLSDMQEVEVSNETTAMADKESIVTLNYASGDCQATIKRYADKELPIITDSYDAKYYDNRIRLTVNNGETAVVDTTFTKKTFMEFVNTNYIKPGSSVLLALAFDKMEGDHAVFNATVGEPDDASDEVMTIRVLVSSKGAIKLERYQDEEE